MDEIERLFIIRVKDPDARAIVRGRLGSMGAVAVTPNIWELLKTPSDDPDAEAEWWDDELKLLEDSIDPRTDCHLHVGVRRRLDNSFGHRRRR